MCIEKQERMGTISAGAHHYLAPLRRHQFRQGPKPTIMIETLSPVPENKHRSTTGPISTSNFFAKASITISVFQLELTQSRLLILS